MVEQAETDVGAQEEAALMATYASTFLSMKNDVIDKAAAGTRSLTCHGSGTG